MGLIPNYAAYEVYETATGDPTFDLQLAAGAPLAIFTLPRANWTLAGDLLVNRAHLDAEPTDETHFTAERLLQAPALYGLRWVYHRDRVDLSRPYCHGRETGYHDFRMAVVVIDGKEVRVRRCRDCGFTPPPRAR